MTEWTNVAPKRAKKATNALRLLARTASPAYAPPDANAVEMLDAIATSHNFLLAAYAARGIRPTPSMGTPTAPAEGDTAPSLPLGGPPANTPREPIVGDPEFAAALEAISGMTYARIPALAAAISPPLVSMLAQQLLGRMSDAYAAREAI